MSRSVFGSVGFTLIVYIAVTQFNKINDNFYYDCTLNSELKYVHTHNKLTTIDHNSLMNGFT